MLVRRSSFHSSSSYYYYDQLTVRALQLVYKTTAALGHGAGCLTAQTQTRTLPAVWCLQRIKSALAKDLYALDIYRSMALAEQCKCLKCTWRGFGHIYSLQCTKGDNLALS